MKIWDYERGIIVDDETGEVIDIIYDEQGLEYEPLQPQGMNIWKKTANIANELSIRGLRDEKGTYILYRIGETQKTVKSLKRDVRVNLSNEEKEILDIIERDPVLAARTDRMKIALAKLLYYRKRGHVASLEKVAREVGVSPKALRKFLNKARMRLAILTL